MRTRTSGMGYSCREVAERNFHLIGSLTGGSKSSHQRENAPLQKQEVKKGIVTGSKSRTVKWRRGNPGHNPQLENAVSIVTRQKG